MRKNLRKSPKTGRFVDVIPSVTRNEIRRLAQDYDFTLTEVAKMTGVDLDTVLRHKGSRLTKRQQQKL